MSCVDTKIVGLEHLHVAVLGVIRKKHVQEELATYLHLSAEAAAQAAAAPEAQAAATEYVAAVEVAAGEITPVAPVPVGVQPPDTGAEAARNAVEALPADMTAAAEIAPVPPVLAVSQMAAEDATAPDTGEASVAPVSTVTQDPDAPVSPSPHYSGGLTLDQLHRTLQRVGAYQFIDFICCSKVNQPALHIDPMKLCPTTIPLACTYGRDGDANLKCPCCGIHRLPIL